MKRSLLLLMVLTGCCLQCKAQVADDFSDGDYSHQPVWHADNADWRINTLFQLQSDNNSPNSQFQIVTRSSLATEACWEWQMELQFNTSSANYVDVFLTATDSLLSAAANEGYFVRIGNSTDDISLYRKSGTAVVKLVDGRDGLTNRSSNNLRIRVTRDAAHHWTLYRDSTGSGMHYYREGAAADSQITRAAFFGILVKQSTATSFAKRHFFDSIRVQTFVPDTIPPVVTGQQTPDSITAELVFSEGVDAISALDTSHYAAGTVHPVIVSTDVNDLRKIQLRFPQAWVGGVTVPLSVSGLTDVAGNCMRDTLLHLRYFQPRFGDVVIHEIMADPTPAAGLPELEWVELKNNSQDIIQLQGWRFGDETNLSSAFPPASLNPGEMMVVCGHMEAATLFPGRRVLSVSGFPSLNNEGELLYLLDGAGTLIHVLSFQSSWYGNELKREGGWTLEMKDAGQPCKGADNWEASTHPSGGTPGLANSVEALNPDNTALRLLRAYPTDSLHLVLVLTEPALREAVTDTRLYSISEGIGHPVSATVSSLASDRLTLTLAQPLRRGMQYTITAGRLPDCAGNQLEISGIVPAGIPETALTADVVIHEVLFNPPFDGADYVELYNPGNKIIDLSTLHIANRNTLGAISNITACSTEPRLLMPGDYCVLSENSHWISRQYAPVQEDALTELTSLPAFPDDKGSVILLNEQGQVVDELNYSENWHFALIDNPEGVSLERISSGAPTQDAGNWHSAAGPLFGTPGRKNSQAAPDGTAAAEWQLTPRMISPDNDGLDDYVLIEYRFPQPGYVANIIVFDAAGRRVRQLQRNALCGREGSFRWDGLGDLNRRLPAGIYIIWAEVFNLDGRVQRFKNAVAIARP